MNLIISRKSFTTLSVTGSLSVDGVYDCFTLEPPRKADGSKPRAIDNGTYDLTIRWSWKHNKFLPHVENVPSFVAIEIHVGNYPKDTDGCCLVGETLGPEPNFIGASLVAFTKLFAFLLSNATLSNPNEPNEKNHIWNVGRITYQDIEFIAPDVVGDIA